MTLVELGALITEANVENQALAFDCIQLVMLAGMQLEPLGSWAYHLEATRRLIELQGGLSGLFYQELRLQNLLINYMEVDIMNSATCPVGKLIPNEQRVYAQQDYTILIAEHKEETLNTAYFMPIHFLQATADITRLRLQCFQPSPSPTTSFVLASEYTRIQRLITTFPPTHWAAHILRCNVPSPQPASSSPSGAEDLLAMAALARCHQVAAALYLHLSCNPCIGIEAAHSSLLNTTHRSLTASLAVLLAQASLANDSDAPLHALLYKFAVWPLFVAANALVGWDLGELSERDGNDEHDMLDKERKQDLERLQFAAAKIQSRPLNVAVSVLERVRSQRALGGFAAEWTWDEAFEGRCSFCVLWSASGRL